jgi:hypothetical protein
MADEQTTPNPNQPARTETGAIVDQGTSLPNTNQEITPETKPVADPAADGKTLLTEGQKEPPKTEEKPGAPEKYEDYKVPEGYTLDPAVKTSADTLFKELGLDQASAQKAVDFYIKQTTESFQAPYKAYQEMTDGWRKDAESHPDLKGKLGHGQEINVRIAKALDGLNDPKLASDFKGLMDLTGAGNHPAFIRVINELAKGRTEGTHVSGNGPSKAGQSAPGTAPPSLGGAMWPTLPSRQGG